MLTWIGVLIAAYLLGSIPSGVVVGKLLRGVDVRKYGSGNIGATNALRILGVKESLLVLAGDFFKGVIAVLLARLVLESYSAETMAAVAAIVGHNWSVFIGFSGGKGVSTSMGALTVMAPVIAFLCLVFFVIVVAISRYVSLGSILGALVTFILMLGLTLAGFEPLEYLYFGAVGACLLVFKHRGNLVRLRAGTERKFGQREKADSKA